MMASFDVVVDYRHYCCFCVGQIMANNHSVDNIIICRLKKSLGHNNMDHHSDWGKGG